MVIVAIGISTLSFLIETLPAFNNQNNAVWTSIEGSCIGLFTLEFIIRVSTCPSYWKFCKCTSRGGWPYAHFSFDKTVVNSHLSRRHRPGIPLSSRGSTPYIIAYLRGGRDVDGDSVFKSSGLPGDRAVLHRADGAKRKLVHVSAVSRRPTYPSLSSLQNFTIRVLDSGAYQGSVTEWSVLRRVNHDVGTSMRAVSLFSCRRRSLPRWSAVRGLLACCCSSWALGTSA